VFVVVNLTLIALWWSVASTLPDLRGLVVASIAVLAVGIVCLVGVIVLGTRRRGSRPPAGATGSTAATVLAAVAVAQLVVGLAAMTMLGAFADLFALQIFLATMVSSVAVLILGVGLSRHISRTPGGV
jgi:nitrate reductase gamma subunit